MESFDARKPSYAIALPGEFASEMSSLEPFGQVVAQWYGYKYSLCDFLDLPNAFFIWFLLL